MLDVCLLGTGGMMPLPYRWLNIPDGALQWKQSSGRLWRGNTDCDKRKGMEEL